MRLRLPVLGTLVGATIAAAALFGLSASSAAPEATATSQAEQYVDMADFSFTPRHLVVRQNAPVQFVIANRADRRDHQFNVRGQGEEWNGDLQGSGTVTALAATFTKPGTYQVWCSVGSHRVNGMVGTLTVVPESEEPALPVPAVLNEFSIQPLEVSVVAGQMTRFEVRNVGDFPHDFTIEGRGMRMTSDAVLPGETTSWLASLPEPGTYEVYCSIVVGAFNHRELGMVGSLEVLPNAVGGM